MGVKDRSFWKGFNRTFTPSMNDVMQSELSKKLFKENATLKNLMDEEDDRRESKSLQESIIGDQELTPEERAQFAGQFGDGKTPLSKEARARINTSYTGYKETKRKSLNKTAEEEKTTAKEKATAKASFEAQKRRIPKDATDLQAAYGAITDPSAADVEALRDDIKLWHDRSNQKPDKPNETETKIGLVKKATEIGSGDPYKGWQIIKEQDPTTYYEAQQRGIKTERDDKVSPKAEKLLEDVQGEWQYERDQYQSAIAKAQKDQRVVSGDMSPEDVVKEQGIEDPGAISMFAFKYLRDRKDFLNEDAVNEAFHMLNKTAGSDKTERGMLPVGGKAPSPPAPLPKPGEGSSAAPSGAVVSAGQEASLIAEEERWKKLLDAAEQKYGIKK